MHQPVIDPCPSQWHTKELQYLRLPHCGWDALPTYASTGNLQGPAASIHTDMSEVSV